MLEMNWLSEEKFVGPSKTDRSKIIWIRRIIDEGVNKRIYGLEMGDVKGGWFYVEG